MRYTPPKIAGINIGKKIEERSKEELVGSSFKEFKDSNRYETFDIKTPHILVFKFIFEKTWSVSVNQTDVVKIQICKQDFSTDLIPYTNSEGCVELL